MAERSFSLPEIKTKHMQRTKCKNLDFLCNQGTPGPFTSSNEALQFFESAEREVREQSEEAKKTSKACTVPRM